MSNRWPGGLIRKTPVTPTGPYQNGTAPGVWSLADAAYWTKQGLWPIAGNIAPIGAPYWLDRLYRSTTSQSTRGVAVDTDGNVYSATQSDSKTAILKTPVAGNSATYQTYLQGLTDVFPRGLQVDASGKAHALLDGTGSFLVKLDATGGIEWQKSMTGGGGRVNPLYLDYSQNLSLDTSGNTYLGFSTAAYSANVEDGVIMKVDSSGNTTWSRYFYNSVSSNRDRIYASAVDASGNVYGAGAARSPLTLNNAPAVIKFNSSGTLQWQKRIDFNDGSSDGRFYSVCVDSSGNVYACGRGQWTGGVGYRGIIAKFNSSGTLQWQKQTSTDIYLISIGFDPSGNIIVSGQNSSSNTYIAKFSSAGSVLWQRELSPASSYAYPYDGYVDRSGNVYVSGESAYWAGDTDGFVFKGNTDGGPTGTFSGFTYAASAVTISNPSFAEYTNSPTVVSGGWSTGSTTSITVGSAPLTIANTVFT